jgi:hypothetical protein
MKTAKAKCCKRTHAQSILDGLGGHVKGISKNHGGSGCYCKDHLLTVDAETVSGRLPVWAKDGKATSVRVEVSGLTAEQAAGLKLDGWKIEAGYKASRLFLSSQGLDKAITSLPNQTEIRYLISGASETEVKGKADHRTYAKFAFAWVKDLRDCGAPSLKGWSEDDGFCLASYAIRTGRNLGIAEMMHPKMEGEEG